VQAKELREVRAKAVLGGCSKGIRRAITSSQLKSSKTASFSTARKMFQSKPFDHGWSGKYAPWKGIDSPQKTTHHSSQRIILTRKLRSVTPSKPDSSSTARPSGTIVTPLQILPLALPLSASTGDLDSGSEQHDWPFPSHKNDDKELDVEMTHVLSHGDIIECVKFSRDGKQLAAGCHDGKAYIYDVETGTLTW